MSKERLEEIQNEVNYAYRRNGSISTKAVTMPIEHYEHLYEQAELVEELEQQNKRYREALIYVTKAHIGQYHDSENMLEDIKFVVNKTLECDE